jgi:peroxiredoxin
VPDNTPPLPRLDFDRTGPAVGTRFPDLVLPDQSGSAVDLHAARAGRKALVMFHRSASW